MKDTIYTFGYTTGGVLYFETLRMAELAVTHEDWAIIRAEVMGQNLLQARTQSTAKRIFREIASRLKRLTKPQITLLAQGSPQDQLLLLWLAICKRYTFIHDFAVEVLREKFLRLEPTLSAMDYEAFFNARSQWHPEMEKLTAETRAKLKQVLFKMMRDVQLLSRQNEIIPLLPSPGLITVIYDDAPQWLAIYPLREADIRNYRQ